MIKGDSPAPQPDETDLGDVSSAGHSRIRKQGQVTGGTPATKWRTSLQRSAHWETLESRRGRCAGSGEGGIYKFWGLSQRYLEIHVC